MKKASGSERHIEWEWRRTKTTYHPVVRSSRALDWSWWIWHLDCRSKPARFAFPHDPWLDRASIEFQPSVYFWRRLMFHTACHGFGIMIKYAAYRCSSYWHRECSEHEKDMSYQGDAPRRSPPTRADFFSNQGGLCGTRVELAEFTHAKFFHQGGFSPRRNSKRLSSPTGARKRWSHPIEFLDATLLNIRFCPCSFDWRSVSLATHLDTQRY